MRQSSVFCIGVCAFLFLTFAHPLQAKASQFVKVENSLANIYEFLDPKSNIIRVAKKGDYFEMVFEGTSWYQIKVQDKVGWLEKKCGTVVDNPHTSNAVTYIIITILLLGTLGGVYYYIYKQKAAEA
jgi:hypothetical protein